MQALTRRALWAAHTGSISWLQWMQHNAATDLIMSASADKRAAVWVPEPGILIGDFGQQQLWDADDPKTWKDSSQQPTQLSREHEKQLQQSSRSSSKPTEDCCDGDVDILSDDSDVYSSGDDMLPQCFINSPDVG